MAHSLGLGTCWIGFAQISFNVPEIKKELGIPEDYTVVAPLIVGYPEKNQPGTQKKDAEILFWK